MLPWIIGGLLVSSGIAYGFAANSQEFFRYLVLALIGFSGLSYWLYQKQQTNDRVAELEGLLEKKKTDERVEVLEKMLEESDQHISNQEDVIKNYETMLEEASVKFPCNCGQNMFDGIFKPEEEVVVECDYCKAKYSITLKLDKVLITETEDLTIEQIIKE
jgi:hypothetical protein